MLKKNKFLFVFLFFVFLILISLSFFSAGILDFISSVIKASESSDGANCGMRMGNYSSCMLMNSSCRWMNNSNVIPSYSYCPINYTNYNSTSVSMWFGNQSISFNTLTGGSIINAGCCEFKSGSGGSGSMGCMRFSGNKSGCGNSSLYGITGCSWKPNDLNQNSMCPIKKIGDWGPNGVINSISDVGCCENQGCWAFKGNQTSTNNCTTALGGACVYSSYGAGCSES